MRLFPVLCAWLAFGCTAQDAAPELVHERLYAMGTWVDVQFHSRSSATAATVLADVERMLRAFERDYHAWTPGALADINASIAAGQDADVEPGLLALLRRAQALSIASDGFFDPGVGSLVELWGFHSTVQAARERPTDAAIDTALASSGGIAALEIGDARIRSSSRALVIDLGGIAKGEAVAQTIAILERHGIANALVNAGGDLAAIGHAPGDRAWRVGVRHSRADSTIGTIELGEREAAFTSGDYERFYMHEGQRLHHLLDPKTGRPPTHTQALTVLSSDPVLADAAATALFAAGPERWRTIAENLGISAALRIDADGTIEMTPAMTARIQLSGSKHDIIAGSAAE